MNVIQVWRLLGVALTLLLSSACGPNPSAPASPDSSLGEEHRALAYPHKFCALSKSFSDCRPLSEGPQAVYDSIAQALVRNCGNDFVCLQQAIAVIASSPGSGAQQDDLAQWTSASQQGLEFLKSNRKSAESLAQSMEYFNLELKNMLTDQKHVLAYGSSRVNELLKGAETSVKEQAKAYREPVVLELADVKAGVVALDEVVAETRGELAELAPQVVALANRFRSFKATEAATTSSMHEWANQASSANFEQLATLQVRAVALAQAEHSECSALGVDAARVRAQLVNAQEQYKQALAPHREFIAQRGLSTGDLISGELKIISGIASYGETRRRKVLFSVDRLLNEFHQRREILTVMQADAATKQSLADAAFLKSSQNFLDEATARNGQLWKNPPTSTVLKLPFLSVRFDEMTQYLQLEPLCAPPASGQRSWHESGCAAMRRDFSRVRTYLSSNIPSTLRLDISMMRRAKTVPEAMLADIESKLAAGQIKHAIISHDAALRVSDGA